MKTAEIEAPGLRLEYYGEARTLDVHISSLRKKLGHYRNCIETVIGIGYRFHPGAESAETTK
jgi:DNA-binding response OmpR family regulator